MHMSWFSHDGLDHVVNNYGYVAVALTIGIESMGVPLPGETILVLAAMYPAVHTDLNIYCVAVAAVRGAIVGVNIGYWLSNRFGYLRTVSEIVRAVLR